MRGCIYFASAYRAMLFMSAMLRTYAVGVLRTFVAKHPPPSAIVVPQTSLRL